MAGHRTSRGADMTLQIRLFVRRILSLKRPDGHNSIGSKSSEKTISTSSTTSTADKASAGRKADKARALDLRGDALDVATKLDGETMIIPNLWQAAFEGWPVKQNKHIDLIRELVDQTLERIIEDPRKLSAMKKADFGRLIALYAELEVATAYSVWIFVWDDEVDAGDTEVSTDEDLAHTYGHESQQYVRWALGLETVPEGVGLAVPPNKNMVLFADVATALNVGTDLIQRRRFADELAHFMRSVGVEHAHRLRGTLPSVEEYLIIRGGSVGCAPQIALTDHMLKIRLPEDVMESGAMRSLWHETVVMCLILNDVFSVQKEINQGSLFNLVPVMFKSSVLPSLDSVTNQFVAALKQAIANFESTGKELVEMTSGAEGTVAGDTAKFIEWCRYFTTGVLVWSLESKRYDMAQLVDQNGSLEVVL